ncbi:MAG: hypothetical protein ACYTEI_09265 [Planctomycetota bacterium]|jgi:hypothetical protein
MMFWRHCVRCLFLPLLLLFLLGCGTPRYASNWSDLEAGMARGEVLELLGEPGSRVRLEQPGGRVARERWQYGDDSTSATSPTGLGIAPPADAFVVTFGADGKVADYRRPLVGPHAEPQDLDDPPSEAPE